jgi:hypothetical protein
MSPTTRTQTANNSNGQQTKTKGTNNIMNNQIETITVKTRVIAGSISLNHNAIAVKSNVNAGGGLMIERKGR